MHASDTADKMAVRQPLSIVTSGHAPKGLFSLYARPRRVLEKFQAGDSCEVSGYPD